MARPYILKRRAEQQSETRQRIVEAAVELHSSLGPARTSLSMVAERAGVQRHTLYAHFPDERSLHMACSGLALERDPLPDPDAWAALPEGSARVGAGIGALFGWYARNADLAACVLRDAEAHEVTREIVGLRFGPPMRRATEVLNEGLSAPQRAMLHLMMGYPAWRSLVQESGLSQEDAVAVAVRAVEQSG
ncbi:TetR/AcrR family transcriptional regulator [Falsiroseomonas sp. HW251]|uniref:TetR/AcrR family transcriptional regulator n=1 Tax=Falsiroseomonas sp. HW251 TaxID=3390998 RepID=UPI003D324341